MGRPRKKVEPRFRGFIEKYMMDKENQLTEEDLVRLSKEQRVFTYQTQPNMVMRILEENLELMLLEKRPAKLKKVKSIDELDEEITKQDKPKVGRPRQEEPSKPDLKVKISYDIQEINTEEMNREQVIKSGEERHGIFIKALSKRIKELEGELDKMKAYKKELKMINELIKIHKK